MVFTPETLSFGGQKKEPLLKAEGDSIYWEEQFLGGIWTDSKGPVEKIGYAAIEKTHTLQ